GMIITFESITASGSSDPKLMAQGIGQAMIATVLGLGVAIPLLFLNTGLVALSRSVINELEEQGTRLMANKLEGQHQSALSRRQDSAGISGLDSRSFAGGSAASGRGPFFWPAGA